MKRIRFRYCALFFVFLYAGVFAFGQNDRATISGTVSDPSGARLTGTQILAIQTDTGTSYPAIANKDGIYTIPGLPVGTYTLRASHPGFKDYVRTDIILIATQVLGLNVRMVIGSSAQTVTVTGGVPLLETESSSVSTTMEQAALRDLPLDATGGRDAMNLMLAVTPLANTSQGGQNSSGGTQNWNIFAGQEDMTNSVYIDGIESTAGMQGQIATPGLDALSEVQIITSPSDAEFGTGGGVELFQIKSGTNKFHGSAFEFLQNEDLNANSWASNYFLAQCAPSDVACRSQDSRGRDRFNDYGFSAGGPIWKNHTFVFGDFEEYMYTDYQLNPNSVTVPTPQMLNGDFSQLLTGGANQGNIPGPNGAPWINPCTSQSYQYGQIFQPQTQTMVNGATCATPFPGNIATGQFSAVSQQIAKIYTQYYAPTISSRIYDNFPSLASGTPSDNKRTIDLKVDHTFSNRHHLSGGWNYVSWKTLDAENNGLNYSLNAGPLSNDDWGYFRGMTYRIIDNYSITSHLLNTVGIGFSENLNKLAPQNPVNPDNYGITGPGSPYFPRIIYDGDSNQVGNGVNETNIGSNYQGQADTYSYQYQDTMVWNTGRHNIKFGGTFKAQGMNSKWGQNLQTLNFYGDTGGPTDPGLTPYVGFAFANQMLGDVQSASVAVTNGAYPRQKEFSLFFQDDYSATPRLTLNLGIRWDVTGRDHEKNGNLQNFDLTAQNPLWAPYTGAWVFSKNSGTSFETNQDYHQFGPHIGGEYRFTDKLVGRASYGIFFVPDNIFNATWGGIGAGFPSLQTELAYPINQVTNNIPGSVAYNWDNGYPGVPVLSPQNSSATLMPIGNIAMYTHPDFLHLGYTQNFYVGSEYEITKNTVLNLSYVGNRGRNLHDPGRSLYRNSPSWNAYSPVLLAGHINDSISNTSEAAADGVPYPYPGFSGPAYAAIAPFPQIAGSGSTMQVEGDPADSAVTAFNAFVAEVKARNYHGLFLDFSYTMSKMTGSYVGLEGWSNNWSDHAQNLADWNDEKHWVQAFDQKHLAKGYATYLLPFGRGQKWLPGSSRLLNPIVSGWELGYYGSYGSGTPMGAIVSSYQIPYYFNTPYSGDDRANFRPGLTATSLQNHFRGHLDLANLNNSSNTDFNPNLFTATSAAAPFGNTPYTFNHWRWNPGIAHENMSLLKHFSLLPENRIQVILGIQFFDIFNRHYYGAPDQNMSSSTFGQVTTVSGYRYGQLSARVQW